MNILNITKEHIDEWVKTLPRRNYYNNLICDSLIVIPSGRMHSSGVKCMSFIALDNNNEPICVHSTGSDTIHFNSSDFNEWKAELLPCGFIRIFVNGKIKIKNGLGNFQICETK